MTGSTVVLLLASPGAAFAEHPLRRDLALRRARCKGLGLAVEAFEITERLDLTIDAADQIARDDWPLRGALAAHGREKIVAAAADCSFITADSSKPVERLRGPLLLEQLEFGLRSPEVVMIAGYEGPFNDPAALAARPGSTPGVVGHGLFPPEMVAVVLVGHGESGERIDPELAS